MTESFALDFIPKRMKELGYGEAYTIRFVRLIVLARASLTITANNQLYYLIDPHPNFTVSSKFGAYDLQASGMNALQYEHRGKITINNTARFSDANSSTYDLLRGPTASTDIKSILITFIQVTPKNRKAKSNGDTI